MPSALVPSQGFRGSLGLALVPGGSRGVQLSLSPLTLFVLAEALAPWDAMCHQA